MKPISMPLLDGPPAVSVSTIHLADRPNRVSELSAFPCGANWRHAKVWLVVAATASWTALTVPNARAALTLLPDLPDFYQHQWSGSSATAPYNAPGDGVIGAPSFFGLPGGVGGAFDNPATPSYTRTTPTANNGPGVQWEYDGGWCWTTSFTNVLYQMDKNGAAGLFTHAPGVGDPATPNWLERMTYAVEDTTIKFFDQNKTMDQIITGWVGAGKVTHDVYTWNVSTSVASKNGVDTTTASMFDLYRSLIDAGTNVMIRINGEPTAAAWWANSYHQITGAGYDTDGGNKVYFADPNNAGSGAAGANWGHSYAATDPLPVGAAYYDMGVMNANGTFSSGAYAGAGFVQFDTFSVVPEPGSVLAISCFLASALMLRSRPRAVALLFYGATLPHRRLE